MSLEKAVCDLVRQHWGELHQEGQAPESLVFLKIAGKTSPNASIIAMVLDAYKHTPVAVAKIPRNPQSALGLKREHEAMNDLRTSIINTDLLSHTSAYGTLLDYNGVKILLQIAGMGHPMVRQMTSRKTVEELYGKILPWMADFHAEGAEECILEGIVLGDLVKAPIDRFMEKYVAASNCSLSDTTKQFFTELPDRVEGRRICLCRQHGDFNAHNTLVEYSDRHLKNFTLIDWEDYRAGQLPVHDLNHFFTSNSNLLSAGNPPEESYANFVLNEGWYRDLYTQAIATYEDRGLIDRDTFMMLTPLYLVDMCSRIEDVQRAQQYTAPTWIKRLNKYIESHVRKVQ